MEGNAGAIPHPMMEMSVAEIEEDAKRTLPPEVWKQMIGAAESGATFRRNQDALSKILFKQRILHGITSLQTSIELFGQQVSTPLLVAPLGSFWMIGPSAEHDVVEGASLGGTIAFVTHAARSSVEEFAEGTHAPLIWMSNLTDGEEETYRLARVAEKLGYVAVGLTVDSVEPSKVGDHIPLDSSGAPRKGFSATPKNIERLKKEVNLPIVVKGIMGVSDAVAAVNAGADALVVSNHGGRKLDYSLSAIEVLPEIVSAVGGKTDILIDSGFRRGTDALKALAIGAKAVLIGRPVFCGVAVGGPSGVARVIELMTEELKRTMMFTGVGDVRAVDQNILIFD